ncbi:TrgA family protein [Thalassobius sp. I31.1]|uniref:TrgA family protein n=1 Tax=Thalassobius sp. I31.1 TaxID=2109912 RepID=UPI000D1B16AE|nr:TrgA family protein [Thalassobius sp. I31.1]
MPTASRLVGALTFTVLAFIISTMILPLLPEGTSGESLWLLNCPVGLVCGWKIMGPRGESTRLIAFAGGVTTSIAAFLVAVFLHAGIRMVNLSMRKIYHGVTEAIGAVFEISMNWASVFLTTDIVTTLIAGGIFCGWLSWKAQRYWG